MGKRLVLVLFLVCLMFPSVVTFQPAKAVSKTILVPDNYPTITAAIGNAAEGDVIYVRNGFYNETVLEIDKTLTLRGEDVRNTIVHLNPPLVNFTNVLGQTYLVPSNAIRVNAINVRLSDLTITSPGGISATGDGTEIISNIITIGRSPFQLDSFITVFRGCILSGSNLTIAKNTLTGDDWSLTGSNQNLVENAFNGTISTEGNNCIISDNNIIGDLIVQGSSNAITRNSYSMLHLKYGDSNTINGNSGELSLGNSDFSFSNNTVSGNIIKGSSPWGIWIGSGGRNNIFYENHIADKGYTPYETEVYSGSGIVFGDNSGVAVNNTFYHNVFINNTKNVKFNSDLVADGNFWDNGVEGNYWSDYNGTDADNDGVGDTPYIIDTENSDGYPLVTPLDIPAVFVPLPEYDPSLLSPEPSPSPTPTPSSTPTSALDSTQSSSISSPSPLPTIPELPSPVTAAILMATIMMGAIFHKNNNQEKWRIRLRNLWLIDSQVCQVLQARWKVFTATPHGAKMLGLENCYILIELK